MKNYLVIGNPVQHSISPKIHNYWFKENNVEGIYKKKALLEKDLKNFVEQIKSKEITGANVTVPFKQKIIKYMEELTPEAQLANSVNTIFLSNKKVVGHNTDIDGFYLSINLKKIDLKNKEALILGSGGVTPSIIIALKKLGLKKITISNRTKEKAIELKDKHEAVHVLDWGKTVKSDVVINSTSIGLNESDNLKIDFDVFDTDTLFYDVIYSPKETNFLKEADKRGFRTQNGFLMFIYQAAEAFKKWHNIVPKIDEKLFDILEND